MKEILRLDDVKKYYGSENSVITKAIKGISFTIFEGELVAIMGASGSGKSTLIKMLYREEKPTRGVVQLGGINVGKLRNRTVYKLRRKLGIVFQDFKLLPKLTVYENVAFALECIGMKNSDIRPKVLKALEHVGLKDKIRSFPNELSGGEQQRVCIARAIVNDPKLLICDEPTGNLDANTSKEIMEVLDTINKNLGTTIIMATHDLDIVKRMKRRVLVLDSGVLSKDYEKGSFRTSESV